MKHEVHTCLQLRQLHELTDSVSELTNKLAAARKELLDARYENEQLKLQFDEAQQRAAEELEW